MNSEVGNLLEQLVAAGTGSITPSTRDQFHQVAQSADPEALSRGLTEAFNSSETPAFGEMVAHMFGRANPDQKAGIVNRLLGGIGPAAAAVLSQIGVRGVNPQGAPPTLSPDQVTQLSTNQVQQIATHAKSANPGIVESMSNFYAQHPVLVKSLGAAAMTIILSRIGSRTH